MKRTPISKQGLLLLIIGLMITALTPIIGRYYPLPDLLRGFLTGFGLTIELIGLIMMQRSRKRFRCREAKD